eukprot:m.88140 g.88140  ORF g.88140 m.88140 type:complete len:406 (-) comp15167_c0_seq1:63-1280(-)
MDLPVILTNTSAELWPARTKWTAKHLQETMDVPLRGVKVTPRKQGEASTPFFYFHKSPMDSHPELLADYKQRAYTRMNMTMQEFFLKAANRSDPHTYSYADKLDNWGVEWLKDVLPLEAFIVVSPGFDPANDHLFRQTHVWVSPPNTTTPCHFDLFHNFYVQLAGRKRFLLFPPAQWQQLYLYPLLHPAGRSTQVDLDGDVAEQRRRFPAYVPGHVRALVADLGPGDVLYLPPLWFHHVTAVGSEASVSISVWSPYLAAEIAVKIAEKVPLPIRKSWSSALAVAALRTYLESLVAALDELSMNVADFVSWTLLENRYKFVGGPVNYEAMPGVYCWDEAQFNQLLVEAEELVRTQLTLAVDYFRGVLRLGGPDRLPLFLADYFEVTVNSVVGPTNVRQFLRDLVYC